MRSLPIVVVPLAILLVGGCGRTSETVTGVDTSGTKTTPPDTVAASITGAGVLNQTGVVGAMLASPLQVVVKNKAGDPLKNKTVTFAVASGGGTMGSPTVLTDAGGQASSTWILGPTAGTQTATAAVAGLSSLSFTATAAAGAASKLVKVAGDSQSVVAGTAVTAAPTIKVTDASGNAIPGALVSFTIGTGGGAVAGSPTSTASDGTARPTSWTLGRTAGANALVATSVGMTATFTATGIAGPATAVRITSTNPTSLSVGQTTQLTVAASDANGNTVTTTPTFASGNNAVVMVSAAGLVSAVAPGTATVTATVGGAQAAQPFTVVGHSGSIIYDTTALANNPGQAVVAQGDAFVVETGAPRVARISPDGTVDTTITLGGTPVDIAADAFGTTVVVATSGANQLSILDLANNAVAANIALPATPGRVALTSTGKTAFVSLNNGQLAIIDLTTRAISSVVTINVSATTLRMAPGDTLLYGAAGTQLVAFNAKTRLTAWSRPTTGVVGDIEIANAAAGATPQYLYIANTTSGQVDVFSLSTFSVAASYPLGGCGAATYLAKTPDGTELYVTQTSSGCATAMVIGSGTSLFPSRNLPTGGLPARVAFEPSGTWAVIPNASGWVNFIH